MTRIRYRCTACGNLTRFDVTTTRTTRAHHHYTVGGELVVEDEEVQEEWVDAVTCRWCGHGRAVEMLTADVAVADAAPGRDVGHTPGLGRRPFRRRSAWLVTPETPDTPEVVRRVPEGAPAPWQPPPLDGLIPIPTYLDVPRTPVSALRGVDLGGQPVHVDVVGTGRWTLLVFLSARCDGCIPIWEALADPQASGLITDEVVVAVTRDPDVDDPLALGHLAPQSATVVMSSDAWAAYRVQGPPFFTLVDGRDGAATTVASEGVAWAVAQIAADVARARGRS